MLEHFSESQVLIKMPKVQLNTGTHSCCKHVNMSSTLAYFYQIFLKVIHDFYFCFFIPGKTMNKQLSPKLCLLTVMLL